MLLLGVIQAQASGAAGSYDLLETQVLSSSAASVSFTGLSTYAADYQHLQLRIVARTNRSGFAGDNIVMQLNGDSATNYTQHYLIGTGSSVISGAATSQNSMLAAWVTGATATTNVYGAGVVDLLDAFSSSKNTTLRSLTGALGETQIRLVSGAWLNTSAVTSITLGAGAGTSIDSGSRFSLYGIKAA